MVHFVCVCIVCVCVLYVCLSLRDGVEDISWLKSFLELLLSTSKNRHCRHTRSRLPSYHHAPSLTLSDPQPDWLCHSPFPSPGKALSCGVWAHGWPELLPPPRRAFVAREAVVIDVWAFMQWAFMQWATVPLFLPGPYKAVSLKTSFLLPVITH